MFASKRLTYKKRQEDISVTNNLFMNFIIDPWRLSLVIIRRIISIGSACGGKRPDDI